MPDTCRACGAPIQWVLTSRGKKMPLDVKKRTICVIAETLTGLEIERMVSGYESHFANCPDADEMRGTQR